MSQNFLNSFYFRILLIGLALRFFLATTTFHSDLLAFHFSSFAFANNFVLNIYEYLHNPPHNIGLYGTDFFTWPPLTYFLQGAFFVILKPLFNLEFTKSLTPENLFQSSEIFKHFFLLKVPYLVFDLLAAFVILKLFLKDRDKKLAFSLWIFNPITLYSAYMIGQFDILPTFFIILALYFAGKNKTLSLISLGVGGALKIFPLLLVPFAAMILEKNFGKRIWLFILGLLPFLVTIAPFLTSQAFRSVALFSAQSQKILFAAINVSGADVIYLFVFFYFFLLLYATKFSKDPKSLWKFFLAVFLVFYSLTNYHPQWFLWITPLFILLIIQNRAYWPQIAILLLSFLGITLLFEPSLSVRLFTPIAPSLSHAQGLSAVVERFIPPHQISSILRSIFAATSAYLIVKIFEMPKLIQKQN